MHSLLDKQQGITGQPAHFELRTLTDGCSEEEAETLLSVCQAVLSGLRAPNGVKVKGKEPASL